MVMQLVKEYINEKFTDESDPITDMGIGAVNQYKNLVDLVDKHDNKKLLFTIYIRNTYIDFWFSHPHVKPLSKTEVNDLFNYVKNIIYDLGLSRVLIDPKLIKHDNICLESISKAKLPMIVRFKINPQFRNILKPACYNRGMDYKVFSIIYSQYKTEQVYKEQVIKHKRQN